MSSLSPGQRLSIERGAADLVGATEQSFLSAFLYVSSATTLVVGIVTTIVLFAELWPSSAHMGGWGADSLAALSTALACLAAHAVTTPLAILVGRDARERHERGRSELLLTTVIITPFGLAAMGSF